MQANVGAATYTGAMVGYRDATADTDDGFVTGDVEIGVTITGTAVTADVEIENVMQGTTDLGDLVQPTGWDTLAVTDVPDDTDGMFGALSGGGRTGTGIGGRFYGPNAEEVGGVIDLSAADFDDVTGVDNGRLIGSFGAAMMDDN